MDSLHPRGPARGFSLIELAVVVAVIAALMTLGLGFLNAQVSSAAYATTKKRQEVIKDALIAYLGAHRRLPCPEVLKQDEPITGIDTTAPDAPCPTPPSSPFGVIPFVTLGLAREIAEDGWGNLFSYHVFSDPPTVTCPGHARDWGNSDCFGAGKATPPTPPSMSVFDNAVNPPLTANAIAVIISHGPNGLGAWTGRARATRNEMPPDSSHCGERRNANAVLECLMDGGGNTPRDSFFKGEQHNLDDVVAWIDGPEAINALVKQGTVKSAIAQVNDELQTLYEQAMGQNLSSPKCVILTPTLQDPWGMTYVLVAPDPSDSNVLGYIQSATDSALRKPIYKDILDFYRSKAGTDPCPPPPP